MTRLSSYNHAPRTRLFGPFVLAIVSSLAIGTVHAIDTSWNQWRGADRSGVSSDKNLLDAWPEDGPPLAWKCDGMGQGYSSVAISDGLLYTMGDLDGRQLIIAVQIDGGELKWNLRIGDVWGDGGPRSTPTVAGGLVYALGPHGDLVAARAKTGDEVWRRNLVKDFGGRMMSGWGYSESVLVDGEKLIATPGADDAALVALEKDTGKVIWKAAIPDCGGAAYASPVIAELNGKRVYLTVLGQSGGLVGVAAKDGKFLFRHNKVAGGVANVPTPVVSGDLVFYSTGYDDGGSALLRMVPDGDGVRVEEVWVKDANELRNHHGGVVLIGDHLYGGHGQNNGFPFCLELRSGKETWERSRGPGSGSAAVASADGHLYFRYENGVMALFKASPKAVELVSKFRIPDGSQPSWAHPVISGGRLYLRDGDRLLCYDLRKKAADRK
jgi:outer membrane protein assembly factor BamB